MNEVSIIINGVRYDAVRIEEYESCCRLCELKSEDCDMFYVCPLDAFHTFKKSDKKFEP